MYKVSIQPLFQNRIILANIINPKPILKTDKGSDLDDLVKYGIDEIYIKRKKAI
jgi:hypothetical protein